MPAMRAGLPGSTGAHRENRERKTSVLSVPSCSVLRFHHAASEVLALPHEVLLDIRDADLVGLRRRIDELTAFEGFMDFAGQVQATSGNLAPLTRAQVVCPLSPWFR